MTQPATARVYDVVIVGAGICGLMAAGQLVERGASVLLLDKGRTVGGRLATRRIEAGCADHGAQFFTARLWSASSSTSTTGRNKHWFSAGAPAGATAVWSQAQLGMATHAMPSAPA